MSILLNKEECKIIDFCKRHKDIYKYYRHDPINNCCHFKFMKGKKVVKFDLGYATINDPYILAIVSDKIQTLYR